MHRLHLGCGSVVLAGWVNIDIDSPSADVTHDLTLGLPFEDGSVSHIFAEHIIEHIEYAEAILLLSECRRVLAPGGVVRMTTPDLTWLSLVYHSGLTTEWGDLWNPDSPCILLNEGMRAWGHKFLYDRAELHRLFQQAGFASVVDCDWRQSSDPVLCGLESRPYHRDLMVEARVSDPNTLEARDVLPADPPDHGIAPLLLNQGHQLEALRATTARLEAGLRHAHSRVENLQAALARRELEAGSLEAQLIARALHIKGLEAGLADRGVHINGLESGLADRDAHIKGLEAGLADRDTHIKGLEAGLADSRTHIKGLESGLVDRDTHIKDLEARLANRDGHIQVVEASLRDHQTHIKGLEAAITAGEQALADGTAAQRGLEQRLLEGDRRIGHLERLVARLERSFVGRLALRLARDQEKIDTPRTL